MPDGVFIGARCRDVLEPVAVDVADRGARVPEVRELVVAERCRRGCSRRVLADSVPEIGPLQTYNAPVE